MIKHVCDQCGKEFDPGQRAAFVRRRLGRITVDIVANVIALDGKWNQGHACTECIIQAAGSGETV